MVMQMIGNYWLAVLIGLAIGSAVTASGMYVLGFRRVHRGGRTLLVPEIDRRPIGVRWRGFRARLAALDPRRPRAFVALVILMALAVMGGLVQNTAFTYHQRDCNADFQSTSLELRRIAAEDRALEALDDQLRNERDDAMTLMIETLLSPPAPGQRVDAVAALNTYRSTAHAIDVRRDQLTAERAELERQRRAQPAPERRC
ncbi:hypothetical protein [Nocardia sp. NPDC058633]|uniref:hypothetical protein n=1 Tax=Nocardia sp. NPDC058633 TaxID=3346568 RepID=UPI00366814CD